MDAALRRDVAGRLAELRAAGLEKRERPLAGAQAVHVQLGPETEVVNLCANNYLGLANHPVIVAAAHDALDRWGFGMASVRFICGTQEQHLELERRLADLVHAEDAILFPSCFDANGGVFEALFDERDAVISDALNHASIIDGIRLCKARRLRYANRDVGELEQRLIESADARHRLVVTDGVFSMDGYVAPLAAICDVAERHDAIVMVDDSHAVGFTGPGGAGTPAACGVDGRVDIITGTLGKAMGGAAGGYVAASSEVVALLRQRSRPYLFSNSVAPVIVGATLRALDLIAAGDDLRDQLAANAERFRQKMTTEGFSLLPGSHPIVPVMVGDAGEAARLAAAVVARGVYVVAFSYPVVPLGQARIRTQMSAAHTPADIDRAVAAFVAARASVMPG